MRVPCQQATAEWSPCTSSAPGPAPHQGDRGNIMRPSRPATCHLGPKPLKVETRGGCRVSTTVASEAGHPAAQTTGSAPTRRAPPHTHTTPAGATLCSRSNFRACCLMLRHLVVGLGTISLGLYSQPPSLKVMRPGLSPYMRTSMPHALSISH